MNLSEVGAEFGSCGHHWEGKHTKGLRLGVCHARYTERLKESASFKSILHLVATHVGSQSLLHNPATRVSCQDLSIILTEPGPRYSSGSGSGSSSDSCSGSGSGSGGTPSGMVAMDDDDATWRDTVPHPSTISPLQWPSVTPAIA